MNGYLAEVRKTYWAWRYAKAKNDAREYVEKYACYAVRIAIERFEKQSGGSFWDLPLLFGQKFGQALAAILSRGYIRSPPTRFCKPSSSSRPCSSGRPSAPSRKQSKGLPPGSNTSIHPYPTRYCPRRSNQSVGTRPMKSSKFTRPALRRPMTRPGNLSTGIEPRPDACYRVVQGTARGLPI